MRGLTTFPPTFSLCTYNYDPMGRPVKLTDNSADLVDWVKDVAYNAAGQMTQMTRLNYIGQLGPIYHTETRNYNARNQLTRLAVPRVIDHEYRFSETANDGRITQRKDWRSGEEVSYQYDSLNRLISAVTTGPEWGQSFSYDGFGNLLNQTVTKGTAPSLAVNVDGNTNRIITGGYSYDANGNLTAMPLLALSYDVENRLVQAVHSSMGTDRYGYDLANRRLWKRQEGSVTKEYTYFYGVNGQLLGTYLGSNGFYTEHTNVWFGSTLIWAEGRSGVADRLGSVVDFGRKYYPYGEEPAATEQNRTKFATYLRDETTALDYAVNRYYGRTIGRFLTSDIGPVDPSAPQSWNRYGYVIGDPVNYIDPRGTNYAFTDPIMAQPSGFGQSWLTVGGYTTIPEYGTYVDLTYVSSWSPRGGGGGGGSGVDPDCDERDEIVHKVLSFLRANRDSASALAEQTGLSSAFILAWAAMESGYGTGAAARLNNNHFGLTARTRQVTGGWIGAIPCIDMEGKTHAGFACFVSGTLFESGYAALHSQNDRYLKPALEAQQNGGGIGDVAGAIARAGFNSEDLDYGGRVEGAARRIERHLKCLK